MYLCTVFLLNLALILRHFRDRSIVKSHIRAITLLEILNLFLRMPHFISTRLTHVNIALVALGEVNVLVV
jgi:hypothetical protein